MCVVRHSSGEKEKKKTKIRKTACRFERYNSLHLRFCPSNRYLPKGYFWIKKKHLCRAFYCTKSSRFSRSYYGSVTCRSGFIHLFWASCRKVVLAFILLTISRLHDWCLSLQYPMECTDVLTERATIEHMPRPAEIETPLIKLHTVWWQTKSFTFSITFFFQKHFS